MQIQIHHAENVAYFQMLIKITFLELGWYNLLCKIVQSLLYYSE